MIQQQPGTHTGLFAFVDSTMWVKICGIRDEATAEAVSRLSPDAIGLNFYAKSPRSVSASIAKRIATVLDPAVQRVGVFVNHSPNEIEDLVHGCSLNAVQLHGDETPDDVARIAARIPQVPIFRAWRMDGESLADLERHLGDIAHFGIVAAGCLIDARVSGAYGGTGHTVPWNALYRAYQRDVWPPLILAGGLTAENIAAAINSVKPWGVDVASGVESSPGNKDLSLVRRFIESARNA